MAPLNARRGLSGWLDHHGYNPHLRRGCFPSAPRHRQRVVGHDAVPSEARRQLRVRRDERGRQLAAHGVGSHNAPR